MLFSYNADLLPQVRMMGQIRYSEPWLHFSRCINEWVLYVIRDGNLYLQEDGVRYHLAAGDFFLLEPGLTHEGYQRSACDYYYVHFSHPDMGRMEDETAAMAALADKRRKSLTSYNLDPEDPTDPITYLPKQFHLTGGEFKAELRHAVEVYGSREEHYKRRTATLLHSFLLETAHENLLAHSRSPGKRIRKSDVMAEKLLRYVNQNYTRHLTSRDIEEQFEGNFDYLNRTFAALTGSPVFTYINILRINNAKQLIATTDLPFSEIGYLVGVEDRYYFSKLFRKMTGMSPSDYYKEVRSE